MLKKAGVIAAAAVAGLFLLASPAFAGVPSGGEGNGEGGGHPHGQPVVQHGLVNVADVDALHNVNVPVGACGDNVGVLGAAVPINSPSATEHCVGGVIAGQGDEDGPVFQHGLVNVADVDALHNVNVPVGACGDNVGVLGAAVPINSPSYVGTCSMGAIVNGHHH